MDAMAALGGGGDARRGFDLFHVRALEHIAAFPGNQPQQRQQIFGRMEFRLVVVADAGAVDERNAGKIFGVEPELVRRLRFFAQIGFLIG